MKNKKFNNKTIFIILILCIIIINFLFANHFQIWKKSNGVIFWDVRNYYGYVPMTFIYNDFQLNFADTLREENGEFWVWHEKTSEGKNVFKTTCGLAYLYTPFFFMGHFTSMLVNEKLDGYGPIYRFFLLIGSFFYLFIGLLYLYKLLITLFSSGTIIFSIILIVFGTNLWFYSLFEATMPHLYNFCLIIIFLYFVIKWYEKPSIKNSIIVGSIYGLIILIRPSNGIIILFFVFWNVFNWNVFLYRIQFLLSKFPFLLIMSVSALVIWIPQLAYWYHITGDLFYYSYGKERFFFNDPKIIDGLIGYRKGWITYTPIAFFVILAIFFSFLDREIKKFSVSVLLIFIILIYITFSWWCWWYGGSFGQRTLIDFYGLLFIPLIGFLNKLKRHFRLIIFMFLTLLIFLNIFKTIQYYYYGTIHYDSMSKSVYWKYFFKLEKDTNFYYQLEPPLYGPAMNNIQIIYNTEKHAKCSKKLYAVAPNNMYISSDIGSTKQICANRNKPQAWEQFKAIWLGENKYAFLSSENLFISQKLGLLFANSTKIEYNEIFKVNYISANVFTVQTIDDMQIGIDSFSNNLICIPSSNQNVLFKITFIQ